MRSKFQLNEGEIQRILNLHKTAILKENGKNIINEENTFTLPTSSTFDPVKRNPSSSKLNLYKGTKFKISKKIPNSLVTTRKVTANFPSLASGYFSKSYEDNKAFVVYNCKTKNFYLIGSTNEGAQEDYDYKKNKNAIWYSGGNYRSLDNLCSEITQEEPEEDPTMRDEVVVKNDKDNSKDEGNQQVLNKQNPPSKAPEEVLRSGYSSDGKFLGNFERALTLSCDNAPRAAKSCNDRSLRSQITINDNCDDTILNDAIQNFSKGVTGVKGALMLIEDGIWGETSKAAWEACKTNMRQGTSGSSGQSGSSGSAGSAGTNGTSGSVGVQGGEDLKLTDAEYVKLTS